MFHEVRNPLSVVSLGIDGMASFIDEIVEQLSKPMASMDMMQETLVSAACGVQFTCIAIAHYTMKWLRYLSSLTFV